MTLPLPPDTRDTVVNLLLALDIGVTRPLEALWSAEHGALPAHLPTLDRPHDRVRAAVTALEATGQPARLVRFLDAAVAQSPERPARAELIAIIAELDGSRRRRDTLGLVREHDGRDIVSAELTVRLAVTTEVAVTYLVDGQPARLPMLRYPLAEIERAHAAARALAALDPAADPDAHATADRAHGRLLYDLLFPAVGPTTERADPLASLDLGRTRSTDLRLRICATDPRITALDWWQLRADGERLVDRAAALTPWTIELTAALHPTLRPTLARTPQLIALSPHARRARALREVLQTHIGGHRPDNRVVAFTDPAALGEHLGARRHPLLLVEGLDRPALDALAATLAAAPADHRPAALIVVGAPETVPLAALAETVAAAARADTVLDAHRWLIALVVEGRDPVTAAHCQSLARPLSIHTRFAAWTATTTPHEAMPLPALVLDRVRQRREVEGQLKSLVARGPHRVEVFVAIGPPRNRVDQLAEQIDEHIAHALPELDFDRRVVHFPHPPAGVAVVALGRAERKRQLWTALATALGRPASDAPAALLRHLAAQRIAGTDRVVWLDWGSFGRRAPLLDDDTFDAWLRWHLGLAAQTWPDPALRIASFIALEVADPARRAALISRVEDMSFEPRDAKLSYRPLEEIGDVKPAELKQYLGDEALSRIPPAYHQDLARALWKATQGRFVPLVRLIERAWLIGIEDLLDELRDGLHDTPTEPGDPEGTP